MSPGFSNFANIAKHEWLLENEHAFAIFDKYPVSPGHVLVITKRLVPTWFEASPEEQASLMLLVNGVREYLDARWQPRPDGYNVGFNAGEVAGQTVMHLHIHVIPRYAGDMPDPRGGVRHVIPSKGNYLAHPTPPRDAPSPPIDLQTDLKLSTGYPRSRLWDQLSCRLMAAQQVEILASFVQQSGLDVIEQRLFQLLRSSAQIRILVSDYLWISDPRAIKRLGDWQALVAEEHELLGQLGVRLLEVAKMPGAPQSFHPKSWRILDAEQSFIAVGSSNLSRPALETGVEWNLLSTSTGQLSVHADFAEEYDKLWNLATPLTADVAAAYASNAQQHRQLQLEPESIDERYLPDPRPWQADALDSLQKFRDSGYRKALVAVATGMGKTWLAAFDVRQVGEYLGRPPRVLVIAHRSHILVQAESVLSAVLEASWGEVHTSWYLGQRSDLSGALVLASVQKLARPDSLNRLANEPFDYAVIDEVHHAHAPTYRRVLAQLNAQFVLGLTATPERGDGVDVASIFDDNLAHHATIGDGIAEESLVPFHYVGLRDTVDFEQIPWRNGRFETADLEDRVVRSERMERLWQAMQHHPGQRTIVFCCSRRHAIFARDWLRAHGMSAAAVFSGQGGDGQIESLDALRLGELQALCAVDMFNEGLDIPTVDRVVMLRPTESKVVFLQQLGRGLRAVHGKTRLLVIDFVGNHQVFAQRFLHLLSLSGRDAGWADLKKWLQGEPPSLPVGCLLDVELEARDLIAKFIPTGAKAGLQTYRMLRDELERRPTAGELFGHDILPKAVSQGAGSWFEFVRSEGDLSASEVDAIALFKSWFVTIETTSLNKSYKMVVLRVLLDHGQLFEPVDIKKFSQHCRRFMLQHPVLRRDLLTGKHALDHQSATDEEWAQWWQAWPIGRWLDVQNGTRWFQLGGNTFQLALDCPSNLRQAVESMTEELVEWRLAAYSKSRRLVDAPQAELTFEAKVSHANGRPIIFLPDREKLPNRPVGLTVVRLPDLSEWEFKFVKVACNVAQPAGTQTNELPTLLKNWFGQQAGLPGTDYRVLFELREGHWSVRPLNAQPESPLETSIAESRQRLEPAIEPSVSSQAQYRTHVPVYDLVAAAGGWGPEGVPESTGWIQVAGHKLSPGMFVARVVGESMEPKISSGAWCLFRPCPAGSRENRLLLVQVNRFADPVDGGRYTVKRYRSTKTRTADGWEHQSITLQPLNPMFSPISVGPDEATDLRIIGEYVAVVLKA